MTYYHHEQEEKRKKWEGPRPGFPACNPNLWPMMRQYLDKRQLDTGLAKENGWYPARYKQEHPRIIIPCSNSAGVPYFQGRDMSGKAKLRYASPPAARDDSGVLVWPSQGAPDEVAHKIKGTVIVEGPMDALAAAERGFLGIGLMGNDPNEDVIRFIIKLIQGCFEPVFIIPDADQLSMGPGVSAALSTEGLRCQVRLSPKKDLAEMSVDERKEFLRL